MFNNSNIEHFLHEEAHFLQIKRHTSCSPNQELKGLNLVSTSKWPIKVTLSLLAGSSWQGSSIVFYIRQNIEWIIGEMLYKMCSFFQWYTLNKMVGYFLWRSLYYNMARFQLIYTAKHVGRCTTMGLIALAPTLYFDTVQKR